MIESFQHIIGKLPLNRKGPEPSTSLTQDGFGKAWKKLNTKFTKKDLRSACDLREITDFSPYS